MNGPRPAHQEDGAIREFSEEDAAAVALNFENKLLVIPKPTTDKISVSIAGKKINRTTITSIDGKKVYEK